MANDQQNDNDANAPPNTGNQQMTVNRIQMKIPPFWKQNPRLWFKQLEAQFATSCITVEITKFNHTVGVIESDVLELVSDIVLAPPTANPYKAIKDRLIKEFTASDNKKIKNLLNNLTLGDLKPSGLLRKMRELSCEKVGDEFLRTLWLQRLPQTIQTVLSTNADNLATLAELADTMFDQIEDSVSLQAVNAIPNKELSDLVNVVCKLDGKIESLSRTFRAPGNSSSRKLRSRSPTPVKKAQSASNKQICFYHKRFSDKANKCKSPCSFKPTKN